MFTDKIFKSKEFVETQLWMYSSFATTSMAFFLALFSAGDNVVSSFSLNIAILFFAISLVFNALIAFLIVTVQKDGELMYELHRSRIFGVVPLISTNSFLIGLLALINYYSFWAMVAAIVSIPSVIYLFFKSMSTIKKEMKNTHQEKMERMKEEHEEFMASQQTNNEVET